MKLQRNSRKPGVVFFSFEILRPTNYEEQHVAGRLLPDLWGTFSSAVLFIVQVGRRSKS